MKKLIILITTLLVAIFLFLLPLNSITQAISGSDGELIKTADSSAVYLTKNSLRYAFPDQKTYASWYGNDFSNVKTVSFETLGLYRLAGLVTYKPNSLIKIQSDPKVYEVLDDNGSISWIASEQDAINRFGTNWATLVRDIPASFFVNYSITGNTGTGINLDQQEESTNICSLEQTPAEPQKESGLVQITSNNLTDTGSAIAWSGKLNGIVWVEDNYPSSNIYFATVDSSNKVSNKIKLNTQDVYSLRPQIIWDGDNFVIVWMGEYKYVEANTGANASEDALYFTKISENGNVVTSQKRLISARADSFLSITANDQGYGLVWDDTPPNTPDLILNKEIFFAPLNSNGDKLADKIQITSYDSNAAYGTTFSAYPKILWNGSAYGLFWKDRKNGKDSEEIYYTRLNINGGKLTGEIRITANGSLFDSLTIVWNGSAFAVGYFDTRDKLKYYFNLINPDGTKKLSSDIQISEPNRANGSLDLAYINDQYYIAATYLEKNRKKDDQGEIYLFKLNNQGNKISEKRITYDPWNSEQPSIINNGTTATIVWVESRKNQENCNATSPVDIKGQEIYFVKQN